MSAGGRGSREAILHGPMPATLFGVAWPMTATLLLEHGQNFLVALWAGRLVGGDSLTALAVMNPVIMLLGLLTGTVHIGVQVLIARATGRADRGSAALFANGIYLGLVWGIAITALGLSQLDTIAAALAGDLTITSSVTQYFTPWLSFFAIPVVSGVVMFAVNATGWTRFGIVRSIASMLFMLVLMPVFIQVFDLGLTGVSLSDGCSDLLLLVLASLAIYAARDAVELVPRRGEWRLDLAQWKRIIAAGLPYQLARGMILLTQIAMLRVLVNTGDGALVAGYGVNALVLSIVAGMVGGSVSPAAGIVIGQNIAAGKITRAIEGLRVSALWLGAFGLGLMLLSGFFEPLYRVFTDDAATIAHADTVMEKLKWVIPANLLAGLLLRANAAIARNRVGNLVSMACSALSLAAVFVLPWAPLDRVTAVAVFNGYVQVAALSVLVVRSLRHAATTPSG